MDRERRDVDRMESQKLAKGAGTDFAHQIAGAERRMDGCAEFWGGAGDEKSSVAGVGQTPGELLPARDGLRLIQKEQRLACGAEELVVRRKQPVKVRDVEAGETVVGEVHAEEVLRLDAAGGQKLLQLAANGIAFADAAGSGEKVGGAGVEAERARRHWLLQDGLLVLQNEVFQQGGTDGHLIGPG